MIITVRDLLDTNVDVDIGNDVLDLEIPAFCGPMAMTDEGMQEYADVLETRVDWQPERAFACLLLDGDERRFDRCAAFFEEAAGWCTQERWDMIFEEVDW